MTYYCTYCSKNKNKTNNSKPAYLTYESNRIKWLYNKSKNKGYPLLILSGKYGLINANDSIDYYDKLLLKENIISHASLVEKQLSDLSISKIIFFHQPIKTDMNLSNYISCIDLACRNKNIKICFEEINTLFD
jgi:hypothetical protein